MKALQEKKYKGIKKVVIKNEISLEDYKQGLFSEGEEMKNVNLKALFLPFVTKLKYKCNFNELA